MHLHILAPGSVVIHEGEKGEVVELDIEPGDVIPVVLIGRGDRRLSEAHIRVVVEPADQVCLLEVAGKYRCDGKP